MKDLFKTRNPVVPLRPPRDRSPTDLGLLALEVSDIRRTNDKLLYRIQQIERREKSLRQTVSTLRRENTALKKRLSDTEIPVPKKPDHRAERPSRNPFEPSRSASEEPDFSSALSDLN